MSSRDAKDAPEDTIAAEHQAALAQLRTDAEAEEVLNKFLELKAREPVLPLPVTVLDDAAEDLAESSRRAEQFAAKRNGARETKPRPIGKAVVGAGLGRATDPRLEAEFVSRNTKPIKVGPAVRGSSSTTDETVMTSRGRETSSRAWPVLLAVLLLATIGVIVAFKVSSFAPTAPAASSSLPTTPAAEAMQTSASAVSIASSPSEPSAVHPPTSSATPSIAPSVSSVPAPTLTSSSVKPVQSVSAVPTTSAKARPVPVTSGSAKTPFNIYDPNPER